MPLRLHNTLSQQVEEFAPARDNTVSMYTCGPTVYDFAHIGNFRTFTFVDLLRKWLRISGFKLDHVMNITDVDDKIIRNASVRGKSLDEYTAIYTQAFLEDCVKLRLEAPEHRVRATGHIGDMVHAIEQLGAKHHTYTSDGSVGKGPQWPAPLPGRKTGTSGAPAELSGRVRRDYQAGADLAQFRRLLVNRAGKPLATQERRGREPADAAAHDRDPGRGSRACSHHQAPPEAGSQRS